MSILCQRFVICQSVAFFFQFFILIYAMFFFLMDGGVLLSRGARNRDANHTHQSARGERDKLPGIVEEVAEEQALAEVDVAVAVDVDPGRAASVAAACGFGSAAVVGLGKQERFSLDAVRWAASSAAAGLLKRESAPNIWPCWKASTTNGWRPLTCAPC